MSDIFNWRNVRRLRRLGMALGCHASAVPLRHHILIYRYRYRILAAWLRAEPLRIGEHYHAGYLGFVR